MNATVWAPPPADLLLPDDEVHVWRAELDRPGPQVQRFYTTLSSDERDRAARFHFERDRQRFIVARGTLRAVLGRYLGLPPGRVHFRYSEHGKPALADGCGDGRLHFNLSHSHALALIAVAPGREVGVDVEHLRPVPDAERVATRFFSPRECSALLALPAGQRERAFLTCWTRKEAFIKAVGEGLSYPLDQFDVSLAPDVPAGLLRVANKPDAPEKWTLVGLAPGPEYVGALAFPGRGLTLRYWQHL